MIDVLLYDDKTLTLLKVYHNDMDNESLHALYQDVILDHGQHPRYFGPLSEATYTHEAYNPLCGDRLIIYLCLDNQKIQKAQFHGQGCVISMASASLMMEAMQGLPLTKAMQLKEEFIAFLTTDISNDSLGKLAVFKNVKQFPSRIKCANLAWHGFAAACGLLHQ